MNHRTVSNMDRQYRQIVNDRDTKIYVCCDPRYTNYILTTSPTPIARESILHVQGTGEMYCFADSFTKRLNMQSYLIMLTLSGHEEMEYQGNRYVTEPGTFYWIDCMHLHNCYTLAEDSPRHALWVHFYGPTADFYYRQFLRINDNSPVCRIPENSDIIEKIKQVIYLFRDREESLEVDILGSALVASIAVSCIQAATAQDSPSSIPKAILAAKTYIRQNFAKQITLDVLAEQFSINKYYLQKQFKRYFGISPSELLTHMRIIRAKELLRLTDNPIEEIANEVGIHDTGNFSRTFKRSTGVTPSAYRRYCSDPSMIEINEDS